MSSYKHKPFLKSSPQQCAASQPLIEFLGQLRVTEMLNGETKVNNPVTNLTVNPEANWKQKK